MLDERPTVTYTVETYEAWVSRVCSSGDLVEWRRVQGGRHA